MTQCFRVLIPFEISWDRTCPLKKKIHIFSWNLKFLLFNDNPTEFNNLSVLNKLSSDWTHLRLFNSYLRLFDSNGPSVVLCSFHDTPSLRPLKYSSYGLCRSQQCFIGLILPVLDESLSHNFCVAIARFQQTEHVSGFSTHICLPAHLSILLKWPVFPFCLVPDTPSLRPSVPSD